jgi:hypothetical protein
MKRILLISMLLFIVVGLSFSQMAYNKGDQVVSLGLGIGGFAGAYGSTGIAFSGGYENAIHENISLGGIVGYSSSTEDIYGSWGWKYTYILIGARGAYHFDVLHNSNIDTYAGVMLGYNIVSSSETGTNPYAGYPGYTVSSASASYILFGAFIGGRYYFNPNLAAQVELGYGVGFLNVGIAYKL